MNCLCCGKPLPSPEPSSGWHASCIRKFFNTKDLPILDLTESALLLLAEKSVHRGYTVPGVQKKLSLHLSTEKEARLTLVDFPTGFILKPQVAEFASLPEAEHLVMLMAEHSGLSVVPHALIRMNQEYAYITKRIDRPALSDTSFVLLAMEDFCQLSLRLTQDKYKGSYEQCAKVIRQYSSRPALDLSELFLRLIFCFLTGNSDMHLKNFSLFEPVPCSEDYILSPAYDLLPVNVIMPEDTEEFALQMCGKKTNIQKKHFLTFAEHIGIAQRSAEIMIRSMLKRIPLWLKMCSESFLPSNLKQSFSSLISHRAERLT